MTKNACVAFGLAAIIVLFAALGLSLASTRGALAMAPIYDDCAYLLDAYRRLAFDGVNSIIEGARSFYRQPPHAPVETASIMIGYSLFGGSDAGPYIMNIWGLSVYAASIFFVVSRRLQAVPSILWTALMMFVPAAGAIMTELRPDMIAGVLFAIVAYFLITFQYDGAPMKRAIAIGLLAGFSLIVKPTAIIITLPMLGLAWVIGIVKSKLSASVPKASLMAAAALAILIPFAVVWGQQTFEYVYAVFFTNGDVWVTPGGALFQWTYNSIGPGGKIALNQYFYIGAVVIALDVLGVAIRKDWRQSHTALSYYAWTAIIYAGIAANSQKSPFQGSFFYFPFVIALTIAASRLLGKTKRPRRFIVPALVLVAIFLPPATTYQDARQRPESLAMLDQIGQIITQAPACNGSRSLAAVGPYPITPEAAALRAAKNGTAVEVRPLFLVRDRDEFVSSALNSSVVSFPNSAGRKEAEAQRLPGLTHMDELVKILDGDPSWRRITLEASDPSFVFVKAACAP
ncbi:hypothetical protein J2W42_006310 [Rhizobium tibeticum]|jgi:hypothetical protein|uniref:glycosyltransferase family 39 protein n=1 Tax=Rhizobium tibeticum TaxID=501024 RepID=UPI00278B17F4|nr:glycosyltransferase family 39 protein [Rhizobium tibeticum]MDP9813436.1 hypothetical protein [Rhizobium tibeticum]